MTPLTQYQRKGHYAYRKAREEESARDRARSNPNGLRKMLSILGGYKKFDLPSEMITADDGLEEILVYWNPPHALTILRTKDNPDDDFKFEDTVERSAATELDINNLRVLLKRILDARQRARDEQCYLDLDDSTEACSW